MEKKIDTYEIKNVNFSLIDKNDDRWDEFKNQRLERGFDDSELWNLDSTICKFIYPRLKAFSENIIGYPANMTYDEWECILKQMVKAFEIIIGDDDWEFNDELYDNVDKGLNLFRKYFFNLWN